MAAAPHDLAQMAFPPRPKAPPVGIDPGTFTYFLAHDENTPLLGSPETPANEPPFPANLFEAPPGLQSLRQPMGPPAPRLEALLKESPGLLAPAAPPTTHLGSHLPMVAPKWEPEADPHHITTGRMGTQPKPQLASQPPPQFLVERDGDRYCLLCNQWADDPHLRSKKHTKRAWAPEYYLWDETWTDGINERMSAKQYNAPNKHTPPPPPPPASAPPVAEEPTRDPASRVGEAAFGLATGKSMPSPMIPPDVAAPKVPETSEPKKRGCTWCSSPALDCKIPGTRARYCADCWNWWTINNDIGGAQSAVMPPPQPRDPPRLAVWSHQEGKQHGSRRWDLPVKGSASEPTGAVRREPDFAGAAHRFRLPQSYYTDEILV